MKALLLTMLLACRSQPVVMQSPPIQTHAISTAPSIYELGLTLRDSHDRAIGLDERRGSPVLVSMFYASCAVACPALIDDLSRTLAELPAGVKVLLVSFDPARDTPAKLAELARARGLDDRWTLAVAEEATVRELAASIGYRYRKLDSGEFFHGATIVLLDEDGRPLAKSDGLEQRAALVSAFE